MNAKNFSKLLLMLAISLMPFLGFADNIPSQDTTPSGSGTGILDLPKKDPDIKRSPSRNHLEVVYETGMLTLLSDTYEGEFSMNLMDSESGFCYEVPSMSIGDSIVLYLPIGEYQVEALSDDGMIFKGLLTIK